MSGERDVTPDQAAALLQLPWRGAELSDRIFEDPGGRTLARALVAVRDGEPPEAVAARYDLPWVDGQEPEL